MSPDGSDKRGDEIPNWRGLKRPHHEDALDCRNRRVGAVLDQQACTSRDAC